MRTTSRFAKIAVSAGLVVATGAGVLGITSFASAQIGAPQTVAVTTSDDNATTTGTVAPGDAGVTVEAQASSSETHVSPLAVASDALGVTETELRTELEDGKSIAQVAEAKGVDVAKVIDALVAERKAHIAAHVAEGKLTQAQADEKLADVETRITEMVNKTGLPMGGKHGDKGGAQGHRGHMPLPAQKLADVLNLTIDELSTKLMAGASLADIAEAQNVDITKVKEVLTAEFTAHLDEEVASGEHTQAEADEKLAEFTTRLDDMVNRAGPAGPKGGHGRGGHGPRGFGGHDRGQDAPTGEGTNFSNGI